MQESLMQSMQTRRDHKEYTTSYESLPLVWPLLVIEPPVLLASARTDTTRLRLGAAGAVLICNLERLLHWRLDDTNAVERSILTACMVEELDNVQRARAMRAECGAALHKPRSCTQVYGGS